MEYFNKDSFIQKLGIEILIINVIGAEWRALTPKCEI